MSAPNSTQPANGSLPIGRRIEAWRKTAMLTREECATRTGMSQHRLGRIERGADPHMSELSAIAAALDVPVGAFMEEPMPMRTT